MASQTQTKRVPFKDTMVGPTVVLLVICLVISGALAVTHQITAPRIEQINKQMADEARMSVLPEADSFLEMEQNIVQDGITEFFQAENGAGFVFTCVGKSFGGDITVMVGINSEGAVTGVTVTNHSDTAGVGTKAMEESYLDEQYAGITGTDHASSIRNDQSVDEVSGATVTSNAIYGCINNALDCWKEVSSSSQGGDN